MSESAQLLRLLRRIRRRARLLGALEGAVAGAALGLGAGALGAFVARTRGGLPTWRLAALAAAGGLVAGAVAAALRPLPLVRCARLLDAAIDRGATARDRVLSALSFVDGSPTPLARAALVDAVSRARALAPAFVAPARRPRALPALGGAALALVAVTAWPARAPGARLDLGRTGSGAAAEARVRVAAEAFEDERAEVAAAAAAAEASGDVSLRALAREAHAALDALAAGALGRGEALERLTALAARAKEASDETEAAQAGLRAAAKAFEETAATRALGKALGESDAEATERALDALAARAGDDGPRAGIARGLGAAAAGVARAATGQNGDGAGSDEQGRRRLNRDRDSSEASGGAGEGTRGSNERRLERLRRDLEDSAAACRGDAAACGDRLRNGAGELPSAAREAAGAEGRRRLENAVRQMRERLRRGDLGDGARGTSERRFARVARGDSREGERGARGSRSGGSKGERGEGAGQPREGAGDDAIATDEPGAGEAGDEVFLDEPGGAQGSGPASGDGAGAAASGDGAGAAASGDGAGTARGGDGAGKEAGGEALGRGATPPTRGREREVRVRNAAGPIRSEVIEASARRGFAAREYGRVFSDYQPVVEESLAAGAVPEGRRYVVRRYFQLIRPRAGAPAVAAPRAP